MYIYHANKGHPAIHTIRRGRILCGAGLKLDRSVEVEEFPNKGSACWACAKAKGKKAKVITPPSVSKKVRKVTGEGFLKSYEWAKVRYKALMKCGRKCLLCGRSPKDGIVLNVDHIKPRKTHPKLALDINNLQVLCGDCNHGKGNWDETDWR